MTIGAAALRRTAASCSVMPTEGPRDVEIAHHHGKRLVRTLLAFPQTCHGRRVGRIAGELKPAETLDRKDLPAHQRARRAVDIVERRAGVAGERTAIAVFQPGVPGPQA